MPRLKLDLLESRECPSIWTNATGNGLFADADNWHDLLGPGQTGIAQFTGSYGTNDNAVGASGSFANFNVSPDYTGTISFSGAVTAAWFSLGGGAISQASNADLTVTSSFTWTGGTLNSSANLANVTITGSTATGLIEPTNGGPVNLGSHINLSGGAILTLKEGTVNVTNDGMVFNINANSGLLADPGENKEINIEANDFGGQINLAAATSIFDIKSGRVNSTGSIKNTAGSFIMRPGVLASFTGEVDDESGGPSFRQAGGVMYLYRGTALTLSSSTQALLMSGGMLSIQLDQGTGDVEIIGHVKITGGDIMSGANSSGDTHLFGQLIVEGNVHWIGGTYRPFVSAAFEEDSDTWYVTGTFTIGGTAAIAPGAVDGENNPVSPPEEMAWESLLSDGGITADAGTPTVLASWALDKVNNLRWRVKAA